MFALRTRNKMPPQGWRFREPMANWTMPNPMAKTFQMAVDAIASMRRNNPRLNKPTDSESIAAELDAFTCARLNNDPGWCVEVNSTGEVKKKVNPAAPLPTGTAPPSPFQRLQNKVVQAAAAVRKTAAGAAILKDWLGSGMSPVELDKANVRAQTCADCPKNIRGDWRTLIQAEIAAAVLTQLKLKGQLGASVDNESELGTCGVCLCHLPLKVWVPLTHIAAHTSNQVWSELPAWCWMKVEAGR